MQISGWKKAVLGIVATILLGALGSGLWEIAIRPGGYWFWHSILTAVTFGSKVLKDQVYIEAAKGNHEAAAQYSTRVLGWFLSGAIGIIAGMVLAKRPNGTKVGNSAIKRNLVSIGAMGWFVLSSCGGSRGCSYPSLRARLAF